LRYSIRRHAVERAVERFGIKPEQVSKWFNQMMENATLVSKRRNCDVYVHKDKRIVIDGSYVVTVMDRTDITLNKNVVKAVERELRKAERLHKSVDKKLATVIAELSIEQAQLTLNKLKAKSPKVIASIQTKLNAVNSKIEEFQKEREFNDCNFRELKNSSYAYIAE
jgi:hypothetical protein